MSEKQTAMDQRIHSIEEKIACTTSTSIDSSPESSGSSGKRARITRDLTVSLHLYMYSTAHVKG